MTGPLVSRLALIDRALRAVIGNKTPVSVSGELPIGRWRRRQLIESGDTSPTLAFFLFGKALVNKVNVAFATKCLLMLILCETVPLQFHKYHPPNTRFTL